MFFLGVPAKAVGVICSKQIFYFYTPECAKAQGCKNKRILANLPNAHNRVVF